MQQNNLAIQNAKTTQAINEHQYKKLKEEEEAGNRLHPMDPIMGGLTPSVRQFWTETLGPTYFQKGASGGTYVRQKDMESMQKAMENPAFKHTSAKHFLTDLSTAEQRLQQELSQMGQPDAEGKVQKPDETRKQSIEQQLSLINRQKTVLDQTLDVDMREMQKEAIGLIEKGYSAENVQKYLESWNPSDLGQPVKDEKPVDQFQTFKSDYLLSHPNAGGQEVVKAYEKATIRPVQTELNPYQKFSAGHQLRTEIKANPYVKDYQDVSQKYAVMQRALKESKTSKTLVAVDQALITLFNKMTDPASVVRESEYARTPQDMAMYNRIQGKIDKLRAGGAGMTSDERNALVRMANNFMEVYQGNYDQTITDYKELANQSGLDPKVVGIPYERKNKQTQVKDKLKQKYGLE